MENYEVQVISRHVSIGQSWCATCGRHVATISFDDACGSGLSREAVGRQVEGGRLHLIEAVGRSSMICLNSLMQI